MSDSFALHVSASYTLLTCTRYSANSGKGFKRRVGLRYEAQ